MPRYDTGSVPGAMTPALVPRYDACWYDAAAHRRDTIHRVRHLGTTPGRHRGTTPGRMPRYDSTGSMPRVDAHRIHASGSSASPLDQPGGMATSPMESLGFASVHADDVRSRARTRLYGRQRGKPPKQRTDPPRSDRAKPKKVRIAAGLGARPVRRRRVLLGIGTGVGMAGGGGAATLLTNAVGSSNCNESPQHQPRSGRGGTGRLRRPRRPASPPPPKPPTGPTPLGRDPELHLLRRATFGPTPVDVVAVKQMGLDAWLERQFNLVSVADPLADQIVGYLPDDHSCRPRRSARRQGERRHGDDPTRSKPPRPGRCGAADS